MAVKHLHFEYDPQMDIVKYANERISFNIKRYRAKSQMCRDTYLYTNLTGIILSAAVPIFINLDLCKLYPTIISFLVVALVTFEKVFHFRDRWKNYQTTEEALRREQYLAETNSAHYSKLSNEDKFNLLVATVESIIQKERESTIVVRSAELKTDKK